MSLPGLGLEEIEEDQNVETSQHELAKETEWRFEVAVGKYITVKILTGTAEVFGSELVTSSSYTFTGTKAAIYTWHGCTFEVSGDALQSEYTAEETPMSEYVNVHFALETIRDQSKPQGRDGPRLLILGPENAGKSTLAKTLTAYSVRSARSPVVVNLDVREGVMSVPGTITATVFKTLIDVEEGWGAAPMSGPNGAIPVKLPLVYYYGSDKPEEKEGRMFKSQISRLALAVAGRMANDQEARSAGIVIDTPGSLVNTKLSAVGYDIIQHIISEFAITAVICLGSERLYSDMVKRFDNTLAASSTVTKANLNFKTNASDLGNTGNNFQETISVIKLSRSGGCVDRDEVYTQAFRGAQIRSYFYGNARLSNGVSLQPRQQQVDFPSLTIWRRIGPHTSASALASNRDNNDPYSFDNDDNNEETFLPGGMDHPSSGDKSFSSGNIPLPASQLYERMTSSVPAMRNCLLAVLNCAPEAEQDELRDSSVMGFLFVTDTDETRGRISLLSPVAGRVPNRAIVWGGWPEGILGVM